ncbi:Peptidyl-prolyl cis-trans isomerase [uncultured Paludibacter sp.]|nr:Peptidyl-prolyl cis-trans isomerase [uncultured Paludibacter sp.]
MKFSHKKNLIFIITLALFSYFFTSCIKEDNWVDWKVMNEQWYEAHKNDPGFTVTSSGLCYKVIRLGNPSDRKPNLYSTIVATYTGKLYNDSIFDKGEEVPLTLSYLVEGWQEMLVKMHTGDIYEIYVPWNLGYGKDGSGTSIPPYSTLKFRIELVDSY